MGTDRQFFYVEATKVGIPPVVYPFFEDLMMNLDPKIFQRGLLIVQCQPSTVTARISLSLLVRTSSSSCISPCSCIIMN
jgi:hypothetical protein